MTKLCSWAICAGVVVVGQAMAQEETEPPADEAEAAQAAEETEQAAPEGEAEGPQLEVREPSFWDDWSGSVEAGINGSTGNSETFNFRARAEADRETDKMRTELLAQYINTTAEGDEQVDEFLLQGLNEWLLPDSDWTLWVLGSYEYNEYRDWYHRLSAFAGVGYRFIDTDETKLTGRAGLGGNQTLGGNDETFTPEALVGASFWHQIKEGQTFEANVTVFPSLDRAGEGRVLSDAHYKIILDQESNLYLKVGAAHEYDTQPGDAKRSDLDYYATVGWTF